MEEARLGRGLNAHICFASLQTAVIFVITLFGYSSEEKDKVFGYIFATCFWVFSIVQIGLVLYEVKLLKMLSIKQALRRKNKKNASQAKKQSIKAKSVRKNKSLPGITVFFSNKEAKLADIILIISVVVTVMFFAMRITTGFPVSVLITLLFGSFNFHCILNGKAYKFVNKYKKIKEQKQNGKTEL